MALVPIVLVLALSLTPAEAFRRCQQTNQSTAAVSGIRHLYAFANRRLRGPGYRTLVTSAVRCGRDCLLDDRCFSFHYTAGERLCELNGATASWSPMIRDIVGTVYYGPEKPLLVATFERQVASEVGGRGRPSVTGSTHHTLASASAECGGNGQHLCELWELAHAFAAGYEVTLPRNVSLWYAVPDSQAVLPESDNGTAVRQHGLPTAAPSLGVCCPGPLIYPQDPFISSMKYANDDEEGKASGCADEAGHPCTLPELKAAVLRGYLQLYNSWVYFAMPKRDVITVKGKCYPWNHIYTDVSGECYEATVPNTPRPYDYCYVICCKNLY